MTKGYILWIGDRPYDKEDVAALFEKYVDDVDYINTIRKREGRYIYYRYYDSCDFCNYKYYDDKDYEIARENYVTRVKRGHEELFLDDCIIGAIS